MHFQLRSYTSDVCISKTKLMEMHFPTPTLRMMMSQEMHVLAVSSGKSNSHISMKWSETLISPGKVVGSIKKELGELSNGTLSRELYGNRS